VADDDPPTIQVRRSTRVRVGFALVVLSALMVGFGIGFAVHSPSTAPAAKDTYTLKVGKVPTGKGTNPLKTEQVPNGQPGSFQHFFENSATTTTAPIVSSSTTTAPPITGTFLPGTPKGLGQLSPLTPLLVVCSGNPLYKPTSMSWCSSACSSYLAEITWSSWTTTAAVGQGTLLTNNGIPDCGQGTWTSQPGYTVTLGSPHTVPYCTNGHFSFSALLFTATNLWGNATLPDITPPC
jgi:hypothetical protein